MTKFFTHIKEAVPAGGRIYGRELRNIFHDPGVLLFLLFLPLAYPVIYSLIYNPELVREVPVVVIDSDRSALSRGFTRRFNATEGAEIIGYAADISEARRAVDSKDAFAVLEIPEGFGRKIARNEQAPAVLYCEMSLLLRYRALLFSITDLQTSMGAELLADDISDFGLESIASDSDPMPIAAVSLGNLQSGFDSFIMPGVIILILQQCIVLAVGMLGGARHENPDMIGYNPVNRSRSTLADMIAKASAYITMLIFPILWLLHFVPRIFDFPMEGDMMQIFSFILPMVFASIALGFIVQAFCRERESIFVIWVATSIAFLFLSGLTWPRYAMSPGWTLISDLVPATWGINGYILMNANGSTLSDVSAQWHNLWLLAAFYGLTAWAAQRFIIRRTTPAPANSPVPGA